MAAPTPQQAKVFAIIQDARMKFYLAIVAVVVFLILFAAFMYFLFSEKYQQCYIAGGCDGLFAGIIFLVYRHYFSNKKNN